jgi:hypothetical protein
MGSFMIKGELDPLDRSFLFEIMGGPFEIASTKFENVQMTAGKKGGRWSIHDGRLDTMQVFADWESLDNTLKIHAFGLSLQEAFSIGMHGSYDPASQAVHCSIDLCKLDFNAIKDSLRFPSFSAWQLPAGSYEGIGWLKLEDLFTNDWKLSGEVKGQASDLAYGLFKKEGRAYVHASIGRDKIALHLDEGAFCYKNFYTPLKNINAGWDYSTLSFQAEGTHPTPFYIECKGCGSLLDKGESLITTSIHHPPLFFQWHKNADRLEIDHARGHFGGFDFNLERQRRPLIPNGMGLEGSIQVDLTKSYPFLPAFLQKLHWKGMLQFKGKIWILNESAPLCFLSGRVSSQKGVLKNVCYDRLESGVEIEPGKLTFTNFSMHDPAGLIECPLFECFKGDQGEWHYQVPRLTMREFKPSRLKSETHEPLFDKYQFLIFKKFELAGLNGILAEPLTWKGNGHVQFYNAVRKVPAHPLFAIPSEIILRLGLDPQVLNPVTGMIDYNLEGGRLILTRLKDVYSGGRGSKFYLAKGLTPSWIDLDGNLSLQIKIKQYNLIFKIAELFTFNVKGTLKKPEFTLNKHHKGRKEFH